MPPFERPGLVRDEVYEHLKHEILSGRLEWGERVAEVEIALHLGVSRTPVREAVQRLAQDGLLELIPNRGARVRTVTIQEVEDAYAVREVLDGLAARLAAQHAQAADVAAARGALERLETAEPHDHPTQTAADRDFHHAVASASKNTQLVAVLRTLDQGVARVKLLTREYNQSEQTRLAHHAILDAISAGDPEAASVAASRHVRDFRAIILSRLAGALAGRP